MADQYTDVLEEARERFETVVDTDQDNRDNQREDTMFVYSPGEQWPQSVRDTRKQWSELCLEFNQLKQFVAQVVNDQRQNRPGIRVHPADGVASKETADILQGLIRNIEYESAAEAAYDNGFNGAVVGGRGYWRVRNEYTADEGFDQKVVIEPISDSMSVYPDMDYQQPDGSDRKFYFVTEAISRNEFKRKWPNADAVDFDRIDTYWTSGKDDIIVADYYRRVCTERVMVRMSDGAMGWKDELPTPPEGVSVINERTCEVYTVEWYKIAGGMQVLEKYDWPGSIIPVVCCAGDEFILDGKRVYQGLIRHARDAQSMLNFGMTQQAIHLSLTPRAPWVAAEGQLEGYENIWKDANTKNFSVLPYKPTTVDGIAVPPPQRTAPSMPDAGWANWCTMMISMIRSTIGMYENSLGMRGQETSGRAIVAREKQGDNATFNYVDNLSRAISLTGKILLEVIPTFYDTQRIVHTIGLDETRQAVMVNQNVPNPDNPLEAIKHNDITTGKYSVVVEAGPSYATKRQESADTLNQLVQGYPPLMQVAGDLVVRAQDIPDADVIADRLKLILPPQVLQAEQAKQKGGQPPDPQVMAAMQQKDQQLQQAAQTMDTMHQKIQELESGAQQKISAMQIEAQIKSKQAETDTAMKTHQYQVDTDLKMHQAQIDAATTIQKAKLDADTRIQVALIEQDTAIKVAELNGHIQTVNNAINSLEPEGEQLQET